MSATSLEQESVCLNATSNETEEEIHTVPVHSGLYFVFFIQPVEGLRVMQQFSFWQFLAAKLKLFGKRNSESLIVFLSVLVCLIDTICVIFDWEKLISPVICTVSAI